jgi:hypothetical protein
VFDPYGCRFPPTRGRHLAEDYEGAGIPEQRPPGRPGRASVATSCTGSTHPGSVSFAGTSYRVGNRYAGINPDSAARTGELRLHVL